MENVKIVHEGDMAGRIQLGEHKREYAKIVCERENENDKEWEKEYAIDTKCKREGKKARKNIVVFILNRFWPSVSYIFFFDSFCTTKYRFLSNNINSS